MNEGMKKPGVEAVFRADYVHNISDVSGRFVAYSLVNRQSTSRIAFHD
jgi:hypothetical protein